MKNIYLRQLLVILLLISSIAYSQAWQFEPDSLRDDGPIVPMLINPLIEGYIPQVTYYNESNSVRKYNGFRVQILSTLSAHRADAMRKKLASDINYSARVIFSAPNYKVRVGSFTNRQDADRMQRYLYSIGYRNAWVVRARINK